MDVMIIPGNSIQWQLSSPQYYTGGVRLGLQELHWSPWGEVVGTSVIFLVSGIYLIPFTKCYKEVRIDTKEMNNRYTLSKFKGSALYILHAMCLETDNIYFFHWRYMNNLIPSLQEHV